MVDQTLEDYARQITNVTIIGSILVLLLYPIARSYLSLTDLEITDRYALAGFISLAGMTAIMLRSGNELLTELVYDKWVRFSLLIICIPGVYAFGNAAEFADNSPYPSYKFVMLLIFLFLVILCATAAQSLVIRLLTDSDDDKTETTAFSDDNPTDTAKALTEEARSSEEVRIRDRIMQRFRKDCDTKLKSIHREGNMANLRKPRKLKDIYSAVCDHAFGNLVTSEVMHKNHQDDYKHFVESQGAYNIVMKNMIEIVIESLLTNYENGRIRPQDVLQLALLIEMINYKSIGNTATPEEIEFLENKGPILSKFYMRSTFLNFHFSGGGQVGKVDKSPSKVRTIFSSCLMMSYVEYLRSDFSASLVDQLDLDAMGAITEIFSQAFKEQPTFYYPSYFSDTGETIQLSGEDGNEESQLMKSYKGLNKALGEFVSAYMDNRILSNRDMFRPGKSEGDRHEELQIKIQQYLAEIGD